MLIVPSKECNGELRLESTGGNDIYIGGKKNCESHSNRSWLYSSHIRKSEGTNACFFLYLIHCVLSGWSERAKLRHGQRLHLSAPFQAVVNLLQSLTRKIPISQLSPTSSTVISMISNRRTYLPILQVCLLLPHCSYSPETLSLDLNVFLPKRK